MHWAESDDATFLENNGQVRKEFDCMQWRTIFSLVIPPLSQRCSQDSFRARRGAPLPPSLMFDMLSFYFFQCLLPWGQGCFMLFISKLCASRPGI